MTQAGWREQFSTIYLGQAFSILSSSAVQFAIIWWITVTTGSPLAITFASIAGLLPQAVIGPFAGVWIDRFNRKIIMILADGLVALGSLLLFVLCFFRRTAAYTRICHVVYQSYRRNLSQASALRRDSAARAKRGGDQSRRTRADGVVPLYHRRTYAGCTSNECFISASSNAR